MPGEQLNHCHSTFRPMSSVCLFTHCKTQAYQSAGRRPGNGELNSRPVQTNTEPHRRAEPPERWGSRSNYQTGKPPLETRFPISPKTGRGRGGSSLCFIMIGQITADRLVYAFLTSLITAEGGKNPCRAAEGWDRLMRAATYRGARCLDWNNNQQVWFFLYVIYVLLNLEM